MPRIPENEDTESKRLSLISDAIEKPYRFTSVAGSPFPRNSLFGFTFVYSDGSDGREKAITLLCGPDELEDLGRLLAGGIDWFDNKGAQAESERLKKEES